MLTSIENNFQNMTETSRIIFSIKKQVAFGEAIYVIGNHKSLGNWQINSALRMLWNQGHQWSAQININRFNVKEIQFKYLIANYQNPSITHCQWEQGEHNRILSLENYRNTIICKNHWNIDKITLILLVDKCEAQNQYYIVGNIAQLGIWKTKKKMKLIHLKDFSPSKNSHTKIPSDHFQQNAFDFTLYVNRNQKNIQYYYIKKENQLQKQRNPKRIIELSNLQANRHPQYLSITHHSGDIQIYQTCKFNRLHFSQITQSILVGGYLRTKQDLELLKQQKINAVLSIQSKEDYNSHSLSTHYLKLLCQEHEIKYYTYSIKDNNREDFVLKGVGAFLLLKKLVLEDKLKVYVHCTAGIYRSPQVIVLYLVLAQHYTLHQAIKIVTERHPFAKPNYNILQQTINEICQRSSEPIIYPQ